jgi:hypothetical protein
MKAKILEFNGVMLSVVDNILIDSKIPGDFANLEDLPAQCSKMLIEVKFIYVCL